MREQLRRSVRLWVLVVGLGASGCVSAPTSFYYLEPLAPPPVDLGSPLARLAVDEVRLPAYLDRKDIVSQKQGTLLTIPDTQVWAEPLSDGFVRVLHADLASLLAGNRIAVVPTDFADAEAKVSVHVSRFEVTGSGEAVLEAQWRLVRTSDRRELLLRRSDHRHPVGGPGYEAITAALNETLHGLSRDIATAAAGQARHFPR